MYAQLEGECYQYVCDRGKIISSHASCELMWINHLFEELKFEIKLPMTMYCNNQATIHINYNTMFHERIKYVKVEDHLIWERVVFLHEITPSECYTLTPMSLEPTTSLSNQLL